MSFASNVYTLQPVPSEPRSYPHPKQVKRRHGFRRPQNAYDPNQPDLLHVVINR